MGNRFISIEEAIEEIRKGNILIVTDNEDRENEGDFIMAAEKATPQMVNFMIRHGRGLVCQALTSERAWALNLNPMVAENTSVHTTAFTVSVDARDGTTTGISAFDRAATIKTLIEPSAKPEDLLRPGHIFPLIAKDGGVLTRDGHTEAAVDLSRLAGLVPSGILCEILDEDGTMARLPRLTDIAHAHNLKMVTVSSLIDWRKTCEEARRLAESRLPTSAGEFRLVLYENVRKEEQPHGALISAKAFDPANALVLVHSECFTGEVFLSERCDCRAQLTEALRLVAEEGGVVVYLRQEGRGIGLADKIRAYGLQDLGWDTAEANIRLRHAADERDYTIAASILRDLGITGIRLLTNNPAKESALAAQGIRIIKRIGIEIQPVETNRKYLASKKALFGHHLEYV